MEIIPVLDIQDGVVVHARLGLRNHYVPIQTPLASGSEPVEVARGLMSIHPFHKLYVADLNAICGGASNRSSLHRLQQAFPGITLWVDSGIAAQQTAEAWLKDGVGHLVLGSESQVNPELLIHFFRDERIVLSLDFHGPDFLGPHELLSENRFWPQHVIVMTLGRVGSNLGPDFDRLQAIEPGGRKIYAAGGVRNAGDLRALANSGIAGALVASALHNGQITAIDLRNLQ